MTDAKIVLETGAFITETLHTAIEQGQAVVVLCRSTKEEVVERLLLEYAQVDRDRLHRGALNEDEYERLAAALGPLGAAPIYVDDSPRRNRS